MQHQHQLLVSLGEAIFPGEVRKESNAVANHRYTSSIKFCDTLSTLQNLEIRSRNPKRSEELVAIISVEAF